MYKVLRVICNFFIFIYCKIVYRAKIVGTENIPKTGAIIFCAKLFRPTIVRSNV